MICFQNTFFPLFPTKQAIDEESSQGYVEVVHLKPEMAFWSGIPYAFLLGGESNTLKNAVP